MARNVCLDNAHLKSVLVLLESVAERWYQFGQALKVDKTVLDGIERTDCDSSTQLILVLNRYLEANPTKADLVTALRAIGCDSEATTLENSQITITSGGKKTPITHALSD